MSEYRWVREQHGFARYLKGGEDIGRIFPATTGWHYLMHFGLIRDAKSRDEAVERVEYLARCHPVLVPPNFDKFINEIEPVVKEKKLIVDRHTETREFRIWFEDEKEAMHFKLRFG